MQVEQIEITKLVPYENNPRRNNEAIQKVANSIRDFGWKNPIVVDKDFVIIAGHTRYEAAKTLGIEQVPVIVAADLTPEQAKAYRIADNSTGLVADWDLTKLDLELAEMPTIDFSEYGLNMSDLDPEELGEDFSLPTGDKSPFEQMTFTLATEQAQKIKDALAEVKGTDTYKYIETMGNENANGNALYALVTIWLQQKI